MPLDLPTRFTDRFGVTVPIASAPMADASGGALASAVSRAGAQGFVGGAYADVDWTRRELQCSDAHAVGCGFITCALAADERAFEIALEFQPRAMFLSFGDPRAFARRALDRGFPVILQVQRPAQLTQAVDAGRAASRRCATHPRWRSRLSRQQPWRTTTAWRTCRSARPSGWCETSPAPPMA